MSDEMNFSLNKQKKPLPLCYYGHSALRRKSEDIQEITSDTKVLADKMITTMRFHDGIGLAAAQVGININLVVLEIPLDDAGKNTPFTSPGEANLLPQMPVTLINPQVSDFSKSKSGYIEGCLSIPKINGEVIRPDFVKLDTQLLDGRKISCRCGGLLARCLQHEIDHLNGLLFIDLMSADNLETLQPQLRKLVS